MNLKEIIDLCLSLVVIGELMPRYEINKLFFRKGKLVKVKWIDGSISILKKGEWVHKGD